MFIPEDKVNARFFFTLTNGDRAETAIGFNVDDATGDPAPDILAAFETVVNEQLSNQVVLDRMVITQGTADPEAPIIREYSSGETGSGATGGPLQTCILVKKVTDLGGRANRGRMFLPSVVLSGTATDGNLSTGFRDDVQDAMDAFQAAVIAALEAVTVTNPNLLLFHTEEPSAATPIDHFNVSRVVATQRRRNTA